MIILFFNIQKLQIHIMMAFFILIFFPHFFLNKDKDKKYREDLVLVSCAQAVYMWYMYTHSILKNV